MIVKEGDKWAVRSADGKKRLGTYTTHEKALERLKQIEYFKHKGKAK